MMDMHYHDCNKNQSEATSLPRSTTNFYVNYIPSGIDLLPEDIKGDYLIANQKVPDLVQNETDPIKFLQREDWDPWASARRVCAYWTYRRSLFGDERWLLPLDLSGKGAMREPEIRVLRCGALALATAQDGTQLLIVNLKRIKGETDFETRGRCAMYINTTLSTETSRTRGFDSLMIANSKGVRPSPRNGEMLRVSISSSMCKLRNLCLVHDPHDGHKMLVRYAALFVSNVVKRVYGVYPNIVMEDTRQSTLSKLIKIGLDRRCIPDYLDGDWNYSYFCDMIEERIQLDTYSQQQAYQQQQTLSFHPPISTRRVSPNSISVGGETSVAASAATLSALSHVTELPGSSQQQWQALEACGTDLILQTCSELQKQAKPQRGREYVRQRNALYARRNYTRRKERESALRAEHEQVLNENDALESENVRLSALLEQAKALVAAYETEKRPAIFAPT